MTTTGTLEGFRGFVEETRFPEDAPPENWQGRSADYLLGETLEAGFQHGNLPLHLMVPELISDEVRRELIDHVPDEFGDQLWFIVDAADRIDIDLQAAVARRFTHHVRLDLPYDGTFVQLDRYAVVAGPHIRVHNKNGIGDDYMGDGNSVDLRTNPNYVLTRLGNRLVRSLDPDQFDSVSGPPTMTSLEEVVPIDDAAADYLLALSFVSQAHLRSSLAEIADFTQAKLEHRQTHGKENDISFAEWREQQSN